MKIGFEFTFVDLEEVGHRVKYMSIIDFARGNTHEQERTLSHPSYSHSLPSFC
jgi:hypothetical protein